MRRTKSLWIVLGFVMVFSSFLPTTVIGQTDPQLSEEQALAQREIENLISQVRGQIAEEKYDEALRAAQKALALAEKNFQPTNMAVAIVSYYVALVYLDKKDFVHAEEYFKKSVSIVDVGGIEDRYLAFSLHGLADTYFHEDLFDKAVPIYIRVLALWEKLNGPNNPAVLAVTGRLANIYDIQHESDKAELYFLRLIVLQENTLGATSLEIAKSLATLARIYIERPDFVRADPLIERAGAIIEKQLGVKSPDYANFLATSATLFETHGDPNRAILFYRRAIEATVNAGRTKYSDTGPLIYFLAGLYEKQGNFDQAEKLYLQLLKDAEQSLGSTHADVADLLGRLAKMYAAKKDFGRAEANYLRAVSIREKVDGAASPQSAKLLRELGLMHFFNGEYGKAETYLLRSLTIDEKTLKPDDPYLAASRSFLGSAYSRTGNYQKAEEFYLLALSATEKSLGPDSLGLVYHLENLGQMYVDSGKSDKAESYFQRGLTIREKNLGPTHKDVADSLDALARLFQGRAEYGKAESAFKRALAIREDALGPTHLGVAVSLTSLGSIYEALGDFDRAIQMYQRALTIRETGLAVDDPLIAFSLSDLAGVYADKSDYQAAEPLLKRSLRITETTRGAEDTSISLILYQLAVLYKAQGNFSKAEPLYQRTLEIDEKAYGTESLPVAADLHTLALLFTAQGKFGKAELLFQRSLAIQEKTKGASHPSIAQTLLSMAYFYGAQGNTREATKLLIRGTEISERAISNILATATGTEGQKQAFMSMNDISYETKGTVSLHMQFAPNDIQAARLAFTTVLRRKGRVLDAVSESIQLLRRRLGPEDRALFGELSEGRSQLATLVLNGPGDKSSSQFQSEVAQAEGKVQRLETLVSAKSAELRVEFQPVTIEQIQKAIPEDAVLVEIVSYQPFNPQYKKDSEMWRASRYAAYILRGDGDPAWVDLGDAATIDADVSKLRSALRDSKRGDINQLSRALDEKVMRPIRKLLGGTRKILLSPDGELNLIPFAALVDETGHYLLENFSITYLTSGRDLLRLQVSEPSKVGPVVFGNPLYDAVSPSATNSAGVTSNVSRAFDFSKAYFPPLPGTAGEADALRSILPNVKVLTGADATKSALMLLEAPSILHIATHGFFLPDQSPEPVKENGRARLLVQVGNGDSRERAVTIENPLLRSGLAFAGANNRQNGQSDNGILTALEAASLNLWGTKLVVLSACETGVGEVKVGDGVYGLRRALVIAGSESQVISRA